MAETSGLGHVPTQNDIVHEIMDTSKGVIGKRVNLKTSVSLKSSSLADASSFWVGLGWQKSNAENCKGIAPSEWAAMEAYDFEGAVVDFKQNQSYNLRICVTQLANPKRIAAIGFVVSSQKVAPYKP